MLGCFVVLADRLPLAAICMCFFVVLRFLYHVHSFFLIGFADRPPLVAICVCFLKCLYVFNAMYM